MVIDELNRRLVWGIEIRHSKEGIHYKEPRPRIEVAERSEVP
jgi:hypothetical protein